MKQLYIVGDGKIAEIAYESFVDSGDFEIVAFAVEKAFRQVESKFGLPVIDLESLISQGAEGAVVFVAIGYQECNMVRRRIFEELKSAGFKFANFVSEKAAVPRNFIAKDNTFVQAFVTVQTGAVVGEDVFLFSGCTVGHHSEVKSHSWFASGATVGGGSSVGEMSFLGLNAGVGHNVSVSKRCFIGAGALVLKDLASGSVVIEKESEKIRLDVDRFLKFTDME